MFKPQVFELHKVLDFDDFASGHMTAGAVDGPATICDGFASGFEFEITIEPPCFFIRCARKLSAP